MTFIFTIIMESWKTQKEITSDLCISIYIAFTMTQMRLDGPKTQGKHCKITYLTPQMLFDDA